MTDLAAVVAADVALVESPRNPRSVPAGATITAGMVVRMNTSARLVGADGSAAGTADAIGIALKGGPAGTAISVAGANAIVDLGDALSAVAYGAPVYLSDTGTNTGVMGDAAGTATRIVGWCIPAFGNTTADKLLRVDGALPG
jgi:hypothetical protein